MTAEEIFKLTGSYRDKQAAFELAKQINRTAELSADFMCRMELIDDREFVIQLALALALNSGEVANAGRMP